jgi:acyl carrier protein
MREISYEEVVDALIEKIQSSFDIDITGDLSAETDFMALGLDSLDTMDYIFYLEDEYGVTIEDEQIQTDGLLIIGETAKYIINKKV